MSNKVHKQALQYIWPTIIKSGTSKATLQYQLEALFIVYTTQKFVTTPHMLALTSQSLNKFAYYLPLMRGCYVKQDTLFFDKASTFNNKEVRLWQNKNEFITTEYQRLLLQFTTKKVLARFFSKLNLMFLYQNTNNTLTPSDQYCTTLNTNIICTKYFLRLIGQTRNISKNVRCNNFSSKMERHMNSKSLPIQYKSNMVKKLVIHILWKVSKYTSKKYGQQYFWARWIRSKKRSRQKPIGFFIDIHKKCCPKSLKRCFKSNLSKSPYMNSTESAKLFTTIHCYLLYKQKNWRF